MKQILHCLFLAVTLMAASTVLAQPGYLLRHSMPMPSDPESFTFMGRSSAVSADYVALGAYADDTVAINSGVVRVFDAHTGLLLHTLSHPSSQISASFGYAVALRGSVLAVGAINDNTGANGAGQVFLYDLASPTPTVPTRTIAQPAATAFAKFGSALAFSGSSLVIGAEENTVSGVRAGSVYVYNLTFPKFPPLVLDNPSPAAIDRFGSAVAISGNLVVVGAFGDDTGAADAGAAYVYDLSSATPTVPVQTLASPTPGIQYYYGMSVAVAGTMVVIGSPQVLYGLPTKSGRAYLYDLTSGTPTTPSLSIDTPAPNNSRFGYAVALTGNRLVVGDVGSGGANGGAAYIFDLGSGTPTVPTRTLSNPTPPPLGAGSLDGDDFGLSLSISDDRILVGAPSNDAGSVDTGAGYLYDLTSATPSTPVFTFDQVGEATNNQQGQAVAVSSRWMAVGAPNDDVRGPNSGAVRVYDLMSATPTVPAFTLAHPILPGPYGSEQFGIAVALSGDRLVVGANVAYTSNVPAGLVHVYHLAGATPTVPVLTLSSPSPASGDFFGEAVAISGNLIVVGEQDDDVSGNSSAGSAFVFDLASATPGTPIFTLQEPTPAVLNRFGSAVGISGRKVIVGASRGTTSGVATSGSAYIFDLDSVTPATPMVTLAYPSPASGEVFGGTVAIDGNRAVVGANARGQSFAQGGAAFVYDLSSATPQTPTLTLVSPAPADYRFFASSVSLSGNKVIVGEPGRTTDATGGKAFIFDLTSATPGVPISILTNPAPSTGDTYGTAVSVTGNWAVVGSPLTDSTARDQGAAYAFEVASSNADLSNLTLSLGALSPAFSSGTTSYSATLPGGTSAITVTPTTAQFGATITVNGNATTSGSPSSSLPLVFGANPITIVVTAEDQTSTKTYTLTANVAAGGSLAFANSVFTVASSAAGSMADIVIQRTDSIIGPVSCTLSSADGTATAPTHYTAQSSSPISFADTVATQHLMIPIAANATTTVAKVFSITLGNPIGATLIAPSTATVVILPPASATDAVKPVAKITAPANNATIVDTLPIIISGTATDNIGIAKVQVSINGGVSYADANVTSVGSTSATYTLDVQPLPGVNKLRVRALDFKGNVSTLASNTFTHLRTLTVGVSGPANSGSVSSGFVPTSARQAGKSYTITATPKTGFVFDGWTVNTLNGTGITAAKAELPKLDFIMQSGLALTARFITNPFTPAVTGDFSGLILASSIQPAGGTYASNATVGLCSAKLTGTGALTGTVKIDGLSLPFTAVCDNTGVARFGTARAKSVTLLRPGKPNLVIALQADLTGATKKVTGTLTEFHHANKVAESIILANRHAYNGTTSSVLPQYVKSYTARLKARSSQGAGFTSQDYPQGDGYLTFTVKASGTVTMIGKLADDTAVTTSGSLSQANHWPIFQSLYGNKGSIAADAVLDDTQANTDATAMNMLWFRPFQSVQWYPYGWNEGILVDMLASKYTPSPATVFLGLATTNPTVGNTDLKFTNGLLTGEVTKFVNLTTANVLTNAPLTDTSFTFTPKFTTGEISGTLTHSDGTKPKWQGVLMQKGANKGGHGYFMTTKPKTLDYLGESGAMHWLAK